MYLSSKLRAFTLLECLVALLVIAGSVQVYQGLTTVLVSNVKQVRQQENQDWLLFVQQMEAELEGCQLVKVEWNKLYVKKDNQDLAFGLSSASDFRKMCIRDSSRYHRAKRKTYVARSGRRSY